MGVVYDQRDTVWSPPDKAVDAQGATYGTIQEAVDAANGLVLVGPGTFDENVLIPDNSDQTGMTIMGVGRQSKIDGGTSGHALEIQANDVRISNISVETTPGQGNNYDGILVGDNAESDVGEPFIDNVTIIDSDRHGINYVNVAGGIITQCNIENIDDNGMDLAGKRVFVVNNQVGDSGISYNIGVNILTQNAAVYNNLIYDATTGIRVEDTDQKVQANTILQATTPIQVESSAVNPLVKDNYPQSANLPPADELVKAPNGSISNVVLDNGESAEISIPVPDGETIRVFRWGAYKISDGTTPANLDVELKDGSDTVQTTANTGDNESNDPNNPIASHTNSTGSTSIYKLAVANDTGGTIADPGVGAFFAYDVR